LIRLKIEGSRDDADSQGEVTVLSDGAGIMKRLPKEQPQPAYHVIDWFHISMKIQSKQQIASCVARDRPALCATLVGIDQDIRALKWKLWHGQVERAISALERILSDMDRLRLSGDLAAARLHSRGRSNF
jgi:hypothetical protein